MRGRWIVGGLGVVAVAAGVAGAATVNVDFGQVVGPQKMYYGTNEVSGQLNPSSVAPARLAEIETGWARYWLDADVNPSPGSWAWSTANTGISRILASGARPMVCFVGIPDWMAQVPHPGEPATRNHPRDLNEWANYCLTIVQHFASLGYPVEDWLWEVWNEPNNQGNSGSWSTQEYVAMYDAAAAVLRPAFPGIRLGGPSTDGNPELWIRALLDHSDVQFITWHRYGAWDPSLAKPDSEYLSQTGGYGSAAGAVQSWIDTDRPGEGILNICGELNLNAYCCPIDSRIWEMMMVPWYASVMRHMALNGCDVEMFFVGTDKSWPNYGLFLGTGTSAGLRSPAFFAKRLFAAAAPPGGEIVPAVVSDSIFVEALAVRTPNGLDTVTLINKTTLTSPVTVHIAGRNVTGGVWYRFDSNANSIGDYIVTLASGGSSPSANLNGYSIRVLEICTDGEPCDQDRDDDGVVNLWDNCPKHHDPAQSDTDGDGVGDVCDPCPLDPADDIDGDGFCGVNDNCPVTHNPDQADFDADGVGDACDLCPDTPVGFLVDASGCTLPVAVDIDDDGDVDLEDFAYFQRCLSGPNVTQTDPACAAARLDGDDDVDHDEIAIFQGCLTGPGIPANPACAQ